MPVGEVWGCGKATTKKLNELGIDSALHLAEFDPVEARSKFGINLHRTIRELNGEEVIEWDPDYEINKQIIATRSLGEKTDDKKSLLSSITAHVSRATVKLRKQNAVTKSISLFIQTSLFAKNQPNYSKELTTHFETATSDSRLILKAATDIFESIYKPGYQYARTGIKLNSIIPEDEVQHDLFSDTSDDERSKSLMSTIDNLNNRFGQGSLKIASESVSNDWRPKSDFRDPDYTGSWDELCIVKC